MENGRRLEAANLRPVYAGLGLAIKQDLRQEQHRSYQPSYPDTLDQPLRSHVRLPRREHTQAVFRPTVTFEEISPRLVEEGELLKVTVPGCEDEFNPLVMLQFGAEPPDDPNYSWIRWVKRSIGYIDEDDATLPRITWRRSIG